MNSEIHYKIFDHGWSECLLGFSGQTRKIEASYLSEPLADLLEAANHIFGGYATFEFSSYAEPGEYRWILRQDVKNRLTLSILWFAEYCPIKDVSRGRYLFEVGCSTGSFCKAVAVAATNLLDEHGLLEYRRIWGSAFPEDGYVALCRRLSHPLSDRIYRMGDRRTDICSQGYNLRHHFGQYWGR